MRLPTDTDTPPGRARRFVFTRAAWRDRGRRLLVRVKPAIPFVFGVLAAFLGMLLFNTLTPKPQPLTTKQVSTVVAQAMASATPPPAYSSQVYRIIQPSLVVISTKGGIHKGNSGNAALQQDDDLGLGSGVIISDQGQILTALHVVEGAGDITVTFFDGMESKAQITATQPENDIAVLQPNQLPETLLPAVMGNPGRLAVGDEAYAVGNPFAQYGSLSAGVISGLHRSFKAVGSDRTIDDAIQIDSAVNPGNSGGPLVNRAGQVVGIVVGLLNPTEQEFFIGIGYAVPITTAAGAAGGPQY